MGGLRYSLERNHCDLSLFPKSECDPRQMLCLSNVDHSLVWGKLRFDLKSEANKRKQFPTASPMSRQNASRQELPPEVVLSLQRILDLQHGDDTDALDGIAGQFNTVNYLNKLFPTG